MVSINECKVEEIRVVVEAKVRGRNIKWTFLYYLKNILFAIAI